MSEAVVAKRYADALFQLANKNENITNIISQLDVVRDVFLTNDKLIDILHHPQIQLEDKMKLIDDAFGKCDKDIIHTLKLLIERHRIEYIEQIIDHVTELYNESRGIAAATVYSVRALSDEEKEKVATSLAKQLGKKEVSIENEIDPSVLGGMKIRVGNTIYDGSISGKLNRIRNNIGTATI